MEQGKKRAYQFSYDIYRPPILLKSCSHLYFTDHLLGMAASFVFYSHMWALKPFLCPPVSSLLKNARYLAAAAALLLVLNANFRLLWPTQACSHSWTLCHWCPLQGPQVSWLCCYLYGRKWKRWCVSSMWVKWWPSKSLSRFSFPSYMQHKTRVWEDLT